MEKTEYRSFNETYPKRQVEITKADIKEALLFVEWIIETSEKKNVQAVEVIFNAIKNSNGYAENFKKAMVTAAEVLKRQYSEIKD